MEPKAPVRIRRASASDAPSVAPLLVELGCDVDTASVERRLRQLEASDRDRVYLAEEKGRPVGLLAIHLAPLLHRDFLGRVTALVVTESYRGLGVGTALLRRAERWAVAEGCLQIEINSGDHHEPAHGFYRSRGYRDDDRRFVKEDEELANAGQSNVHSQSGVAGLPQNQTSDPRRNRVGRPD
jgi:GNAT superfamily N-acetyltransferase